MKNWKGPTIIFTLGFLISFAWWFPLNQLKGLVLGPLARSTGFQVQLENLRFGSGLSLGMTHGSLLGLKADRVFVSGPRTGNFSCQNLVVTPQFWSLFTGNLSLGLGCEILKDEAVEGSVSGRLGATMKIWPAWNPSQLSAHLTLNQFSLQEIESFLPKMELAGALSGDLWIEGIKLKQRGLPDKINWNLLANGISTPSYANDFVSVPSIPLDSLEAKGSFKEGQLMFDPLKFGNNNSPMEGNIKINFKLDNFGQPIDGEIRGKIRTNPEFETANLADKVNMDLVFGKVKPSGFREFKKSIQGNVLSLLLQPAEDLPAEP